MPDTSVAAPVAAPPVAPRRPAILDVAAVRRDFPALTQEVNGHPVAYLDNAASAQKPRAVIEAVAEAYRRDYANVHRGVHTLSQRATVAYEAARETAAAFVGARRVEEVVFVRGATEAINLVARSFLRPRLAAGDEVVVSWIEHHSNIVPWQLVAAEAGARVVPVAVDDTGQLDLAAFRAALSPKTRMVAMAHVSNALGTVLPVAEVTAMARERGIPVLLDGAQAAPHLAIDVAALDCDFYAVSGHKMYGPTGIGLLWGRHELLAAMDPYQGGGEMIASVSFAGSRFREPPARFEAGTPDIVGAIGLAAAIRYLGEVGLDAVHRHEATLLAHAGEGLAGLAGVRLIGTAPGKAAVVSFVVDGIHPHDLGTILDQAGIAVRAGHHCAQPAIERFGVPATVRASFGLYNTRQEVDRLVAGVREAQELFAR